jgi:myo-inositol 2-dehydrogenase/D-chiro-inositol 1-dehydrogenase
MNQQLRLGIIGVGHIGKQHAENIATRVRGAKLAAIADVNETAARPARRGTRSEERS